MSTETFPRDPGFDAYVRDQWPIKQAEQVLREAPLVDDENVSHILTWDGRAPASYVALCLGIPVELAEAALKRLVDGGAAIEEPPGYFTVAD